MTSAAVTQWKTTKAAEAFPAARMSKVQRQLFGLCRRGGFLLVRGQHGAFQSFTLLPMLHRECADCQQCDKDERNHMVNNRELLRRHIKHEKGNGRNGKPET